MSQSDKIKSESEFLKFDNNFKNDYVLVKSGKSMFNIKKEQFYNINHNNVVNYNINVKNNYAEFPFNGSTSFFIDFDVPRGVQNSAYQFVLRFALQNKGSADSNILPSPLFIDKVSLLVNSNSLGLDITGWYIYMYNLDKYYSNKAKEDTYANLNVVENGSSLQGMTINKTLGNADNILWNNIELPISLNRSDFPLHLIKDNVTIRIYFRSNVVMSNITNSQVRLFDVGLILRCHELNNSELNKIVKQPKFNHMFNKVVHLKFSLPKLTIGVEHSIPISGFRNVCGGMLLFFQNNPNDITTETNIVQYQLMVDRFNDAYIVDATGKNIMNNQKQDWKWNQYIMSNHFGRSNEFLSSLSYNPAIYGNYNKNIGQLYYFGFCQDGSDSFNGVYSGGYSFNTGGDHILKFTPTTGNANNLELNILAFVPSVLSLENGKLSELLS